MSAIFNNPTLLREYVESHPKSIMRKQLPHHPELYSLKYSSKLFRSGEWDETNTYLRGVVVDADYKIVARPPEKLFNLGIEKQAPSIHRDTMVVALNKVNGFLGAVTYDRLSSRLILSNAGSCDPTFIGYFKDMIRYHNIEQDLFDLARQYEGHTLVFEVCHPEDPHIVPENKGLHLIDIVLINEAITLESYEPEHLYLTVIPTLAELLNINHVINDFDSPIRFSDVRDKSKEIRHEGFVVRSVDGLQKGKIKSPYYLSCRFLARIPKDRLMECLSNGKAKQRAGEEFFGFIDSLSGKEEHFCSLSEQDRLNYVRNYFEETI
jgi:hypothetical protein